MRERLWPAEDGQPSDHPREVAAYFAGDTRIAEVVLLAFDAGSGEPVGFAELSLRAWVEGCTSERVLYLEGWYVEPAWRRRGVGRALVAAAERWGRERGCTEMGSDAALENATSLEAHGALGFAEVGRAVLFRKDL